MARQEKHHGHSPNDIRGQSTKVSFRRILQSKVEIFRKFCPRVKTCRFHKGNQFFHFSFWIHHYYSWAFSGISNWCWSLIGYIFSPINIKFEIKLIYSYEEKDDLNKFAFLVYTPLYLSYYYIWDFQIFLIIICQVWINSNY